MSCCAEETGLARLAEHPGIILFAYLCALLPLAAIYTLDFINKDWKCIRDTRRSGKIYLLFSLPPLAVVLFYIHLQKLAGDYKEMATAITAAILCILHILRTLWGLAQLRAFKEWNVHAFHVLTRMGFEIPDSIGRNKEKNDISFENESVVSEPDQRNEHWRSRLEKCLSNFKKCFRSALGIPVTRETRAVCTLNEADRIVDEYMMVNCSLVDNEFFSADLPCRLSSSLLRNLFPQPGFSISDLLTSGKPEECAVRWTVSFLSRFGARWLLNTKSLGNFDKRSRANANDLLEDDELPNRLAAFIAFNVTQRIEIEVDYGEPSAQDVSILSPLHVMCCDLLEPYIPALKVSENISLPYQMRGRSKRNVLDFKDYATSIRNAVSAWHKESLNELGEYEQDAVLNLSPHQVACFSKMIEEKNSHVLPFYRAGFPHQGLKTFLWQLGHHCESVEFNERAQEVLSNLLGPLPVLIDSLEPAVYYGRPGPVERMMLQASVHADNWLALEGGHFPFTDEETQNKLSEGEPVFCAQKSIEFRRLQLEVAKAKGRKKRAFRKIKFLGCIMEVVRTSLAFWLHERQDTAESESFGNEDIYKTSSEADVEWNPLIAPESLSVIVLCSDQLKSVLRETEHFNQKSLQMRLLWEIQLALIRKGIEGPNSACLMMLCMLGYPSLQISVIENWNKAHLSSTLHGASVQEHDSGTFVVPPGTTEEAERTEISQKHCCLRIDVVEAPQPLHIIFQWDRLSKNATAQICFNEGPVVRRFCWQSWKDAFMGRICAQSEWRSTRLHHKDEKVRKEAVASKVRQGLSESCQSAGIVRYWPGWPPFLSSIAGFEKQIFDPCRSSVDFDMDLDNVLRKQLQGSSDTSDIEIEIDIISGEMECECGCIAHGEFLKAKELLESEWNEEAIQNLSYCVVYHKHLFALELYISLVLKTCREKGKHVAELLRVMHVAMELTSDERVENSCQKFIQFDLKKLIDLFRMVYEGSKHAIALHYQGQALLLRSQRENVLDERCIESFESHLIFEASNASHLSLSHFCLALCYFKKFCSAGHRADLEIGVQHCLSISEQDDELAICVALLIEKGSLSNRELERVNALPREFSELLSRGIDLRKMLKSIFLWSSNTENRVLSNARVAFKIYSKFALFDEAGHCAMNTAPPRATNRLALMYQRGADGVPKDFTKAEALYSRALSDGTGHKDVHVFNAMCNLGVLYGQRYDDWQSAKKSADLFKRAIYEFEEKVKSEGRIISALEIHSSSMNNVAVIMESEEAALKNIGNIKKLYRRSVKIDANPIAMYNLAVLLKFSDPSPSNLKEAEELFSAIADIGADLQSMPILNAQLVKARERTGTETSQIFLVDVEEIDDCLAYVKIIDNTP